MSGLDWMTQAACATTTGLPWTTEPGAYPAVLAAVMAGTCDSCPVLRDCARYAADEVTAGFWAGWWRTHPDEPAQDYLPFGGADEWGDSDEVAA